MIYKLTDSLKESIFGSLSGQVKDTLLDCAEIGIDSVLEDGVLRDIPILGTITALCKTGINIKERNDIKQLITFIKSVNEGTVTEEQKQKHYEKLESDPDLAEKELSRVLLLIDRSIDEKKTETLGSFYCSYIKGAISWDVFCELSEVNDRMVVPDYDVLLACSRYRKGIELNEKKTYQIQRLQSLGLIQYEMPKVEDQTIIVSGSGNGYLTPLGKTFVDLMNRDK